LNEHQPPDFVVVGHVCQDILPGGDLGLGGSVSYAATTAHRLGYRVGVVTSAGPDLDVTQALPGVEVVCHRSAATTIFENIYLNGNRTQILHQRADPILCEQIPPRWRSAPMVYLGSIDQEIDPSVFHCFVDTALIGVMPQGFFRRWDDQGLVSFAEWRPTEELLRRIDVLVISELDVPNPEELVHEWSRYTRIVIITHAERGATVVQADETCHYPARPAKQIDPTGAGDVFSAAFLIRLAETGDACEAARFANAVASFSVEGPGVAGIPLRHQVEAYLDAITEPPIPPP
jgi:sugar/nucleoside kinase (ribokinase family)